MTLINDYRQTEFLDLAQALSETGIKTDTAIAQLLGVNKGLISRYRSGKSFAPPSKLALLRRIVDEAKTKNNPTPEGRVSNGRSEDVNKAADRLEEIHAADPDAFETVRQVILHTRNSVVKARPNSALKKALHEAGESPPSPGAGAPISYKRKRARGTARRSKSPPPSPGQAPNPKLPIVSNSR